MSDFLATKRLTDPRYEFVIEVPVSLVSSRTTHFDKISHNLHAGLLSASPCYDRLIENGDDTHQSAWTTFLERLRPKQSHTSILFGPTPILAHGIEPVSVFSYGAGVGDTAQDWRYSEAMDEIGHLSVVLESQQFILGQTADLSIDVTGLSSSTTIHSITTSLVQTTTKATCPTKYAAPGSKKDDDTADRTDLSDKYELYTHGPTTGPRMPGRQRPSQGSYIWRGSNGAPYVTQVSGEQHIPIDRKYHHGFGVSTTLSLPSPIIGAHPTTINENPAFSTISHYLEISFDYSILGQDIHGSSQIDTNAAPEEGLVRSWKLRKWLDVYSDLSSATVTAAPPYSGCDTATHHCRPAFDSSLVLPSTKARRYISLSWSNTMMRPVKHDRNELQKSTRRHWEEMAGMCACFVRTDLCSLAALGCRSSVDDQAGKAL